MGDTFDSKNTQLDGVTVQPKSDVEHLNDFISTMTSGGRAQLVAEHDGIKKCERHITYFSVNTERNRFNNVLLYNEGAVRLRKVGKENEYIHATQIKSAYGNYILAQSPTRTTISDWYRMIWQCDVQVIVCLQAIDNEDCTKYFDFKPGKKVQHAGFTCKTFAIRKETGFQLLELRFTGRSNEQRILHLVYYPWDLNNHPDAKTVNQLLRTTWSMEHSFRLGRDQESVVLVHGCSGTRRTGTLVVASLLCKQIRDTRRVSIVSCIATVRKFRFNVMKNKILFCLLLEVVLYFATEQGLINRKGPAYTKAIKNIRSVVANMKAGSTKTDGNRTINTTNNNNKTKTDATAQDHTQDKA